jgi:ABC-2 type transport system permease protein
MNTFVWLVRREFWENRAIWVLPAVIAGLMVVAAAIGHAELSPTGGHVEVSVMQKSGPGAAVVFFFATGMIFFTTMNIYAFWYLLDCLYADRRDRSILFWKSMPIPDATIVLSKALVALVALPAVYFVAADVATLLMAAIISVRDHGPPGGSLWDARLWLQQQTLWIYISTTSALWYLPIAGWLMLVSASAKRAAILYAVLPPLGLVLAEHLLIGTHEIGKILMGRINGFKDAAFKYPPEFHWSPGHDDGVPSVIGLLDPEGFLRNPAVWIGAAIGAAFIVGAIELRKRRADT